MDTQSDSSGALDANQAGELFASILSPQPVEVDKAEPEQKTEEATEAKAEDAQATPEATAEEPSGDDDPEVTVKIDGKDVTVKLSELKGSYQKDKSAQQRFEQAAELRKQAEAETQRAQAERQAYAQKLQGIHTQLSVALQQQQNIDWDALKASGPVEFVNQVRLAQERQALYQRTTAELQNVHALNQADQQKALAAHIAKQSEALLEKLPEWKDEAKASAEKTALRKYLVGQGYEENDVSSITDARAVLMARKAMLYDQIMSKAEVATKKVATLPQKVERPGVGDTQPLDKRSSAFQRLAKTGRVEDAASIFASIL